MEILDIDYEKQRLSLGLKQTQKDPWLEKIKKYSVKEVLKGKVTRIVKFGLFVQIDEDLEGLVHISELSDEPVRKPSDVAKIGDEIVVRIIDIDLEKRRMAFSIRQVENPVEDGEEETKETKTKDTKSKEKGDDKETLEKESKEPDKDIEASDNKKDNKEDVEAVSYTHLTLPTN